MKDAVMKIISGRRRWLFRCVVFGVIVLGGAVAFTIWNRFDSHTTKTSEIVKGEVVVARDLDNSHQESYRKQKLHITITEDGKPKTVVTEYDIDGFTQLPLKKGDEVFVTRTELPGENSLYYVVDKYRIDRLILILAAFLLLVFVVAGKKGVGSILGLVVSIVVIMVYIIPSVQSGTDPVVACVVGGMIIMFVTIYLAHGISRRTSVAVAATFCSLTLTMILSYLLVHIVMLSGFGSEEAFAVHEYNSQITNLRGLFIGGILIATLGALDDVTTAQAAAVFELARANKQYSVWELMSKGYSVGREHVVSLINTLVIAYVGSSLALFFMYYQQFSISKPPLLFIFNREFAAEEIVRTIAISTGLILAVPLVTFLAAIVVKEKLWFKAKKHV